MVATGRASNSNPLLSSNKNFFVNQGANSTKPLREKLSLKGVKNQVRLRVDAKTRRLAQWVYHTKRCHIRFIRITNDMHLLTDSWIRNESLHKASNGGAESLHLRQPNIQSDLKQKVL